MELTVISPHPDDAAFSLGGTLDALARRGVAITLVSCHSRSVWAPTLSRRRTADLVSAVRGREDRAYAELLGARLVPLGFADAPLRTPSRPVMGRGSRCDGAHNRRLARALRPLVAARATLIPLGVGGHVDHRAARAAAIAASGGQPLAFYEEIPYALWDGWRAVVTEVNAVQRLVARRLYPLRLRDTSARARRRALGCYPSQLDARTRRSIVAEVEARGGELLWATRNWRAQLRALVACE